MNLLERYIFKIAHQAFWACLFALTGVIWITSALRQIDLLTSKGQTILVFFSMTLLTLPNLVTFIAPFTLLIATLYALNRLNSDSELIVMSASGVKPFSLFKPFFILGLLISLFVWLMSLYVIPTSLYKMRFLTNKVRADFISFFVKEGQFSELEGLTFHYQDKTGEILNHLFIQDRRNPNNISTYVAERGYTQEMNDRSFLVLENGGVQTQTDSKGGASIVTFTQYTIDLSTFQEKLDAGMKPSERSTYNLIHPPKNEFIYDKILARYRTELHDRLSIGFVPLAMVFLGFACLGTAHTTRSGRGIALIWAAILGLSLRFLSYGIKNIANSKPEFVFLLYLIPTIAILLSCYFIFYHEHRANMLSPLYKFFIRNTGRAS